MIRLAQTELNIELKLTPKFIGVFNIFMMMVFMKISQLITLI